MACNSEQSVVVEKGARSIFLFLPLSSSASGWKKEDGSDISKIRRSQLLLPSDCVIPVQPTRLHILCSALGS